MGLQTFPMLTGGKGVHVIVPLTPEAEWPEVKDFAQRFALALAEAEPERFTAALVQGEAHRAHLHRLSAQPARRDRDHALFRPRPRRRAGRRADRLGGAGRDEVGRALHGPRRRLCCSSAPSSRPLQGWGEASQVLPKV